MTPQHIAVLLGGPSAEHDVSLVSGRAIAAALSKRGHDVEGWLIGLDGHWWRLPSAALDEALPATAYDDPRALGAEGPLAAGQALDQIRTQQPAPIVFIALHGPFGEDGTVQALCEAAELAYTGAGVAASAMGMDKIVFKRLVEGLGIPVVPWAEVSAGEWAAQREATLERVAAFTAAQPDPRLVIKPARLGSSIGISIVKEPATPSAVGRALDEALSYGESALVEAYIDAARELEMSVVGNSAADLETFGPGEIFPGHEFYDYSAKYEQGVSRTTASAAVPGELRDRLHELAARAFLAIGATGFARVDFLLGGSTLYLNEINTIPGFTPISLFPEMCATGGYEFGAITERIVELALDRARQRPRRVLGRADLP